MKQLPAITVFSYGVRGALPKDEVAEILSSICVSHGYGKEYTLSVHVVSESSIRRLNLESRGKDSSTDVLSFPLSPNEKEFGEKCLGDIFICPAVIRSQAGEFGVTYREEYVRMLVHGTLHILGFDHDTEAKAKVMFREQELWISSYL